MDSLNDSYCAPCGEPKHLCVCREKAERIHDVAEEVPQPTPSPPASATNHDSTVATEADGDSTPFRASRPCLRCHQTVYFIERAEGPRGSWCHRDCYRCFDCQRRLDASTACDHRGRELYCGACYGKRYGPTGFRASSLSVRTPEKQH
ncbi:hypothetical protein CDCA_CDCA04G1208 [Cyanidium caldarium]|uniref:LIM zinc-binding domain-containing protein n=1 Tax=Cyanidium caldarium TaxID=2771 RepID=A0AAV9ISE4_CYACA|nr:hypothetical protein CDCA_CDCA04G1208 [Cyanidium caldarium]